MRLKTWHALSIIFVAVWLVYYQALSAPLNPIDDMRMVDGLLNVKSFGWRDFLIPSSNTYFRPLIWSSFICDRLLWDLDTSFLHFENLTLHWFNTTLVFLLAREVAKLLKTDALLFPLAAALLFAMHPINSEAVIWVAGRADLMATTFILCCFLGAIGYFRTGSRFSLVASLLAFPVGCLAKETTLFVWPGLLLVGWLLVRQKKSRETHPNVRYLLPAVACIPSIVGYFCLRFYALSGRDLGLRHLGKVAQVADSAPTASAEVVKAGHPFAMLETILTAAGYYGRKLFLPHPLNFGIASVPSGYFWLGLFLFAVALWLIWRLSWSGAFFLTAMSLASVALVVAIGGVSWTPIAERYMYAPSAFLVISLTLAAWQYSERYPLLRLPVLSLVGILLIAGGGSVVQRTLVWSDNLRLMQDTVAKSPDFAMAQNLLAVELYKTGNISKSLRILKDIELPEEQEASLNKVFVYIDEKNFVKAKQFLEERLARETSAAYRGKILNLMLRVSATKAEGCSTAECRDATQRENLEVLQKLLELTHDPFYHYRIGQTYLFIGNRAAAQKSFADAYHALPEDSLYKAPAKTLADRLKRP
jgi:tetratricopeptide (TPR) repeat protein